MVKVFRVQDSEGRGPFRPGLSKHWVIDRDDHENLKPWPKEFGDILPRGEWPFGKHYGCACRTLDQLRRWFNENEYSTLQQLGFKAVQMDVQRVLAEGDTQLVFLRNRPLRTDVDAVELY